MRVRDRSTLPPDARRRRPRRCEDGMSILEVLIAGALIVFIAIGVLPLLIRAMTNNLQGWRATSATTFSRSQLEEYSQLELEHPSLAVAATEATETMYWAEGTDGVLGDDYEGWWAENQLSTNTGRVTWRRTRTLRQYHLDDLESPLAAGAASGGFVHLKESELVFTTDESGTFLGQGQAMKIRVLKAY